MQTVEKTKITVYRPSIAGRIARVIIPFIQTTPFLKVYPNIYDFLYNIYRKIISACYYKRVLYSQIVRDHEMMIKTELTRLLLPYSMGGWRALENTFVITTLAEKKRISGALVECGVARGGTAAMMALANQKLGTAKRIKWFFDSYEGLPEPTAKDYKDDKTGCFIRPLSKGSCLGTLEQVQDLMFHKLHLPKDEIHLVKGWFQDTVPKYRKKIGPIAVLRLDGDWYESTKIPLENFYEQIEPGGYVIIDDYATCFGSQRATDEFRKRHQINATLRPDGRGGAWFEKESSG